MGCHGRRRPGQEERGKEVRWQKERAEADGRRRCRTKGESKERAEAEGRRRWRGGQDCADEGSHKDQKGQDQAEEGEVCECLPAGQGEGEVSLRCPASQGED